MNTKLELLCDVKNILGEGPYYDYRNDSISWIDIVGTKLYIKDKKGIKKIELNEKLGAAIPIAGKSGYLICGETGLFIYDNDEIDLYKSLKEIMKPGMRCNDAKADRMGRLFFSTIMDDGIHAPEGGLYALIDGEIVCMQENTKLGNGMAWNHDDTKFYFNDSAEHKIYEYDYDIATGYISNRRVLLETKDIPDGMSIDKDDNLFIAYWGGSRIDILDNKTGMKNDTISIPTKLVTSCTFSGSQYDELIITTASLDEKDEYAGRVFKLKQDYKGLPENFVRVD